MINNSFQFSNENLSDLSARVNNFFYELSWIHIIIIILASYSMYKCWLYITKFSYKFMDEKDKRKQLKRVKIYLYFYYSVSAQIKHNDLVIKQDKFTIIRGKSKISMIFLL